MSDRVVVLVPGLGALALKIDTYRKALAEGAALVGTTQPAHEAAEEPLIDATQLAAALSLPVTWIEERTRREELPCIRAGRWIRYSRRAVEQALTANAKGASA